MATEADLTPAQRLATALDLAEAGAQLHLQRYRREHPDASEADLAAVERAWWSDRPGARHGDASGPFRPRPA